MSEKEREWKPFRLPFSSRIEGEEQKPTDCVETEKEKFPALNDLALDFAEITIEDTTQSAEPQPIVDRTKQVDDKIWQRFQQMREFSHLNHAHYFINSKFYLKQAQYENAKVFYKQALFMQDFEDNYTGESVVFSAYFPYYQMMSYRQLRTYFTWRTKVRNGVVEDTSLSYAFLYLYELLGQVGVRDQDDALEKLMYFWRAFEPYHGEIRKYLLRWIKDYYIYYEPTRPFREFLVQYGLEEHYPEITADFAQGDSLETFFALSKYKIKQSGFWNEKNSPLLEECISSVLYKLDLALSQAGTCLRDIIFSPAKSKSVWTPFRDALFYPVLRQRDRQVVLSENEVYLCSQNRWLQSRILPTESGRRLLGYLFKRVEAAVRSHSRYPYKLTAELDMLPPELLGRLQKAGVQLQSLVDAVVKAFFREKERVVVSVDEMALSRIRLEARDTQEKLTVPEEPILQQVSESFSLPDDLELPVQQAESVLDPEKEEGIIWQALWDTLSVVEREALAVVVQGEDLKQLADKNGVMFEVLVDGINEKAMDIVGDSILELGEDAELYDEYRQTVTEMVGKEWKTEFRFG